MINPGFSPAGAVKVEKTMRTSIRRLWLFGCLGVLAFGGTGGTIAADDEEPSHWGAGAGLARIVTVPAHQVIDRDYFAFGDIV